MEYRTRKQLKIISVVVLFFAVVGLFIYLNSRPGPTCVDNILNQDETEIDCGGICEKNFQMTCERKALKEAEMLWVDFFPVGGDTYDVAAKVRNPNPNLGNPGLDYVFELKNSAGQVLGAKKGTTFILPNATKYIVENNFSVQGNVASISLKIDNGKKTDWQKLNDYQAIQLVVEGRDFKILDENNFLAEASGNVKNGTSFGFERVIANIILFGESGKPIGAAKTQLNTLAADESREFSVRWYWPFAEKFGSLDMQAETNLYLNENFMRVYGEPTER